MYSFEAVYARMLFAAGLRTQTELAALLRMKQASISEAKKRGITITVEDFGGPTNPGSHMKYLKRFLDEIHSFSCNLPLNGTRSP